LSAQGRFAEVNKRLKKAAKPAPGSYTTKSGKVIVEDPNPPHGEKGEFVKVTVTLSPEMYDALLSEQGKRKREAVKLRKAGEKAEPHGISAIVREAVSVYLRQRE